MRGRSESVRPVTFLRIPDARGSLTVVEEHVHVPFAFGGVRWVRGEDGGQAWTSEPAHGEALVVALAGVLEVLVGPSRSCRRFRLEHPSIGLQLPPRATWTVTATAASAIGLIVTPDASGPRRRRGGGPSASLERFASTTIDDCRVSTLAVERGTRHSTVRVVPHVDAPYRATRLYFIHDVPAGAFRGGHAHRTLEQLLIAVSGSFEVVLNDGSRELPIRLDESRAATYVAPGVWRVLRAFSPGAVCLTLASDRYDEDDYIRDFDEFRALKARTRAVESSGANAAIHPTVTMAAG